MRALVALLPLLLAGCAAPEGLGFSEGDGPRAPYYVEHRAVLSGEHRAEYAVPVEPAAREVNVTAALASKTNGLPGLDATPARLRIDLVGPEGALLGTLQLDARSPTGSLVLPAPAAGAHVARAEGFGAAQDLDGQAYGASYALSVEVLYG